MEEFCQAMVCKILSRSPHYCSAAGGTFSTDILGTVESSPKAGMTQAHLSGLGRRRRVSQYLQIVDRKRRQCGILELDRGQERHSLVQSTMEVEDMPIKSHEGNSALTTKRKTTTNLTVPSSLRWICLIPAGAKRTAPDQQYQPCRI
jgi:hypothetical protein